MLKRRMTSGTALSLYISSVYSPFSDGVGLPLHNSPSSRVLMKSIRTEFLRPDAIPGVNHMRGMQYKIQNLFLTAQSTQIQSVISVPIKDFIHHYPRALFNDIHRAGTYCYDIPGSGNSLTTYLCSQEFLSKKSFSLVST